MIEHQSAQKFALDDVMVDCIGNRLKDSIWRNDGQLLEMGLQMPSRGNRNCWRWAYRCHLKVIIDRNQTKSKLDFNWGRNQNKPLVYLKLNLAEVLNNL